MTDDTLQDIDVLKRDLVRRYGELISGDDLRKHLGYASPAAFRQAICRGVVPIPVFTLPNRRGRYAWVRDLVNWLIQVRNETRVTKRD
ncbi:hypothetical protein HPT27_11520 [Permianibacter sp. IMCC34836]|uniref:hypothetical protein n=1 Tax=Permianibacter fluminis TaxID=2738515 RepID=UPI001554A11C|nr:hypothetical protein [Permianibacter fluminis]NQD37655.1 hypothetical protein [Permianibacter fluminis]